MHLLSILTFIFAASSSLVYGVDTVLVSVAPYKEIVGKVAGDGVDVCLLVPTGTDFHSFEPTPKQLMQAASSAIWFKIGDPFEVKAEAALISANPKLQVVDLRKGLNLLYESHCSHHHHDHDHNHDDADTHIWMSPSLVMQQVQTIEQALEKVFPDKKEQFKKNSEAFLKELIELNQFIQEKIQRESVIFVSHPGYGYFCRDYGIEQISLEHEGKDPTSKQLSKTLLQVKKNHLKRIYVQKELPRKPAQLVADQLGLEVVVLDPVSPEYIRSMKDIATTISEGF